MYRDLTIQIPVIKENYKLHLDFGEVKGLSDLDSTEYHGSKIPQAELEGRTH